MLKPDRKISGHPYPVAPPLSNCMTASRVALAADLLAAWELVKTTGPEAQTFHSVLQSYLIALAKARGKPSLYIQFDSRSVNANWGRWMTFLVLRHGATWRATGRENRHSEEALRRDLVVPHPQRGILALPHLWNDLRVGIIQMALGPNGFVAWDEIHESPAALAHHATHGTSTPDSGRLAKLTKERKAALEATIQPDVQIPQWVFETRGDMSPGHALVAYLCLDPVGPRMNPEVAWPLSGCKNRDDFDSMLTGARKHMERRRQAATATAPPSKQTKGR